MTTATLAPDLAAVADAMLARVRAAGRILLPTHVNVDGDSLGSVLGLSRALRAAGKEVVAVISDGQVPPHLQFLLAGDAPLLYAGQPLPPTDLTLLVDITGPGRLGALAAAHGDRLARAGLLNIDHHVSNERFGALNLVDPTAAATAELIALLLARWGWPLTADVATPLLAGLMTDTLSFQTAATTPRAMYVAGMLLEAGAPLEPLVRHLFRAKPLSTARLFGAVVAAARLEDGLLWSEVTPAMLAACGAKASETEGVITYLTGVEEAVVFALFYERADGWRVSLRSNSDAVDVAVLAQRYGGGGHARAAGCTITGDRAVRDAFLADVRAAIAAARASGAVAPGSRQRLVVSHE
jgi:phosphoesterase RecJ-like protein